MLFEQFEDDDLVSLYSHLLKELRSRAIVRSKNITGDLGERLVIKYYNDCPDLPDLKLAPPGTQHYDAISNEGQRYSIKTTTGNGTGVISGLPLLGEDEAPNKIFDFLVVAQLDEWFQVKRIVEVLWEVFLVHRGWHKTMRAWNLTLSRKVLLAARLIN